MKEIFFCLLIVLSASSSNAQVLTTKKNGGDKQASNLFASAGVSLPQGYQTHDNISGVRASAGPIVSMGYHYFFSKRWGMGLVGSGGVYKSEEVHRINFDRYTSRSNENWQKAQLYISGSFTPLLGKKLAIDIVQGIGVYYMREPAYEYSIYGSAYQGVPAKKDWQNAYNIGLKGRVLMKDNIALLLGANYFYNLNNRKNVRIGFEAGDFQLGVIVNLK
ncbi:MAG: hypothetical protein K0R51_123 [Cytophagaceae bacterium]|jgi:hypothetical protein|nr:hypothetical protein [Cytophagaceae bacterium]